jgi:DNA-binding winged helix-turn-helix (wHTH) protein
MNQRPTLLKPVGPESLANKDDFRLGEVLVRPSLLEIRAGDARETLEPRVMQVLVALAGANGGVVSRDELIRECWGGRIVGEDAINRCVARIRRLADLSGSKAFEVETIPRVGYRLVAATATDRPSPAPGNSLARAETAKITGALEPAAPPP